MRTQPSTTIFNAFLRVSLPVLLITLSLADPPSASAQCSFPGPIVTLVDGNGFLWDITANGQVGNGTIDAFDGGMALRINGVYFPAAATSTELGGRQVVHGPVGMSGLNVTRRVYVPATEGWARFLEHLQNPTGAPITVNLRIETNPGAHGSTNVT
ncbi:MAG: hypothetical protein IIB19_05340, partial [Chloroflexi bacterium]|nr:hypothetical protein [Chloroflexota bacterium]